MLRAVAARLSARNLTVSYGPKLVIDAIELDVDPGDRIAVVGPNGTGKSTLLKALAGLVALERGTVSCTPKTAVVGYLPQEPERSADETVAGFLARRTGVAAASDELDAATAALATGEAGADDRYADALERWLTLGGADFDARLGAVAADLGLPAAAIDQPTATLSGGQAARVSLAAILLARFDVFLLDEPTNDLDLDGLARLERFVDELDAGLCVVSHDRAFLERCATAVLELDEHTHRAARYGGSWLAYLDAKAVARRHAEEAYVEYDAKRTSLAERARRQREWAVQGVRKAKNDPNENDKNIKTFRKATSEQLASKAAATERAMERLTVVDKPWEGWQLNLSIAAAPRSGAVVVRLHDAVVRRGEFTLGPLELEIGWAERVAVLGANGTGKSTLIDVITGRLPLTSGERWIGPSVVIGELEQQRGRFGVARPLIEVFSEASGLLPRECRSLLAKFGLTAEHVARTAESLSPGERTRASLALLMGRGANFIVLDEPTNHLDLPAIEQLEQALGTWQGTLLVVTHDRRFLEHLAIDRTLEL